MGVDGGGREWARRVRREGGLTDRPYGERLSPTGEVLLRSALTNAVGGDAGKVNSTKPFQGLPILSHKLAWALAEVDRTTVWILLNNSKLIATYAPNVTPMDVCKDEERNKQNGWGRQVSVPSVTEVTWCEHSPDMVLTNRKIRVHSWKRVLWSRQVKHFRLSKHKDSLYNC